jgi:hypothetical protein
VINQLGFLISNKVNYFWQDAGIFILLWLEMTAISFVISIHLFRRLKNLKLKIIIFNLLLFINLTGSLFLVGELYFRFIYDQPDTMGNLKISRRWFSRHVQYNLDFFRDRNFNTKKPEGVFRIGVLGDSFSFGQGIKENKDRFSNLLETKLNQLESGKFEVYNISLPGWESKNEASYLIKKGELFDFDLLILSYYLNDIYNDRQIKIAFVGQDFSNLGKNTIFRPLIKNSFFLEFMTARFLNYFQSVSHDLSQRELLIYNDPASWQTHLQTLNEIINWTSRKPNRRLIVVIFPYLFLVNQNPYPAEDIHRRLTDFFKNKNAEVIDLYPVLKNYPAGKLQINRLDSHPSKLVHQITSELLYEKIKNLIIIRQ